MFSRIVLLLLLAISTTYSSQKTLLFDFGGVLTNNPNLKVIVNFLKKSFHLSDEEFHKVNQEKRNAVSQGQTDAEFWLQYAKKQNISLPSDWRRQFKATLLEGININKDMFQLISSLKEKNFQVALLSNIDKRRADLLKEHGLYEPFSPCLLSYELGYEKPSIKIYQVALEKLKAKPEDVIFIDDNEANVIAAKKLGIDAIHFVSVDKFKKELEDRSILNKTLTR